MSLADCPVAERALLTGRPCRPSELAAPHDALVATPGLRASVCMPLCHDAGGVAVAAVERPAELGEGTLLVTRLAAAALAHEGAGPAPVAPTGPCPLSDQEVAILGFAARGLSNPEIAARMYLSRHTVKEYSRNAMRKLDVHTRVEAVLEASRLGLIAPQR